MVAMAVGLDMRGPICHNRAVATTQSPSRPIDVSRARGAVMCGSITGDSLGLLCVWRIDETEQDHLL